MHTGLIFLFVSFIGPCLVIMLLGLETMGLAFSFGNPYSVLSKIVSLSPSIENMTRQKEAT